MDKRERLRNLASANNIDIDEYALKAAGALSIPLSDGTFAIAIDPQKIISSADETVKLAHELGHCIKNAFYSSLSPLETRGRCEHKANVWAARRLIPWPELKEAILSGITEPWELAEHFCVTEPFIVWAIEYYTKQKGYSL